MDKEDKRSFANTLDPKDIDVKSSVASSASKRSHAIPRAMSLVDGQDIGDKLLGNQRSMPLKDKISLGPIEKYTIYNRFPYKLTLHILLLLLMSLTLLV